jgi:hypothetical protein
MQTTYLYEETKTLIKAMVVNVAQTFDNLTTAKLKSNRITPFKAGVENCSIGEFSLCRKKPMISAKELIGGIKKPNSKKSKRKNKQN